MDYIDKFQQALKIPTYFKSDEFSVSDHEKTLECFQEFLFNSFPHLSKTAERYVLSPYSVAYRIAGSSDSSAAQPTKPPANSSAAQPTKPPAALFLAHYDVVPAEKEKWKTDPFGAKIQDGYIYGRGSLDMKNTLIGIMQAAENLCVQGWKPKRDIWFVFGGDEERSGFLGAGKTAQWFKERGQRFDFVLDEGTPVAEGQIKGIETPVALISIEEKGYLSLKLSVDQEPGHASRPPEVQAAAVLARALCKIVKKPFPFLLNATVELFFKKASNLMSGLKGFVMRHARALGPLFFKHAAVNPTMTSMLRTTAAITQLSGSAADNVMPSEASAVINLRLLWPWTVEKAVAFIKKTIKDDRVKVNIYGNATNPVAASSGFMNHGWQELTDAMEEAWPGIPLFPFIMVATTDSRHYKDITDCILRFNPYKLNSEELGKIHGHDERISVENLHRGLSFYTSLLRLL